MASLPHEEATAILTCILEALARQSGKTLSQKPRADLARACELLAAGDDLGELLDTLPEPPRASPGEQAVDPG